MGKVVFERNAPAASVISNSLDGSIQKSFWIDDVPDATTFAALRGNITADLAIVGGGYLGLWTAVLAKQRNPEAKVVLLEARELGWAASGRNGGFCEASITHGESNGMSRWPKEYAQLHRLGLQNLDEIEASVASLGLDCDFERTGSLDLAIEPHEIEWLTETETNEDTVFLDETAVRAEVNSPTYLAAIWNKRINALVHPSKLVHELARVATELGVEIFEKSPVREIETSGAPTDAAIVHSRTGTVRATRVALATNAFPSLLKRTRLHTVPVYDYVLMTEPLSPAQLASIGWSNRQGLADMANQFHYYRLSSDNRILFGGYDAVYHYGRKVREGYEDRPESFERLASHFFTTFPQLEGLKFSHRWAGAIDTSTQFSAFFATARDGRVAYAAGFTGLGVGATRFAAQVLLDKLDGLTTERTELEMVRKMPLPFPPEPIASLGIQATRWSLNQADHNQGRRNVILKTLDALGLGFDS
ncbi:FAD-dependent oxidoreductase [Salinibacterium sp. TMP30]|uniref:NAD(P)/FAD-dependent oxidoreductase n=1 Tax=Salinibacterium sp. TMP30 TaxID=3138237 RepID=UPI003138B69E